MTVPQKNPSNKVELHHHTLKITSSKLFKASAQKISFAEFTTLVIFLDAQKKLGNKLEITASDTNTHTHKMELDLL